jgi:hypothetical protein
MQGPSVEVPDLPDAIVAWRVWWLVSFDGVCRLASAFKWATWPPGQPLVATCLGPPSLLNRLRRRSQHDAPDTGCQCGIYGAELSLADNCLSALRDCAELGRVLGEVSLWGTVIECEKGYRASLAYPRRIYVPADGAFRAWEEIAADLSAYGVPVEALPVRCVDAADELRQRLAA